MTEEAVLMSTRKRRIESEAQALWREFNDEPPPALEPGDLLEHMLNRLPPASYERLSSPYLRRSALSFPKRNQR